MKWTRRQFITHVGVAAVAAALPFERGNAQTRSGVNSRDRVIICNEDSNTLSVIDPNTNTIAATINLTSFDEDPRPPFRLVTGGVTPTHAAIVTKPLYMARLIFTAPLRRRTTGSWLVPAGAQVTFI